MATNDLIKCLIEKREELINQLSSIDKLLEEFRSNNDHLDQDYPIHSPLAKKIKYALKHIGESTAEDIFLYLKNKEKVKSDIKYNKMKKSIVLISSTMYKKGIINAKKVGIKNIYSYKYE